MMHREEKSDSAVVAVKLPNKAGRPDAEAMEPSLRSGTLACANRTLGRAGAKENAEQRNTRRTQSRESVLQSLSRIREAAMRDKRTVFTLIHPLISLPREIRPTARC